MRDPFTNFHLENMGDIPFAKEQRVTITMHGIHCRP